VIVPTVEFPPGTVSISQVTLVLAEPFTEAANVCVCPVVIAARSGLIVTVTGPGAVIVTVVLPDFVPSATETAVTVTVAGEGTAEGAVKSPLALIVPCVESPPVTPFTCQVTAVLEVFVTVAVNCCVAPVCTVGVSGPIVTTIGGGGVTVTVAVSDFVLSATEVAFTVTVPLGTVAGAV